MHSPPGSRSDVANRAAGHYLFQKDGHYTFAQGVLVVARRPAAFPATHPCVARLTQRLLDATLGQCERDAKMGTNISGGERTASGVPICWWRNMHSIFAPDGNALAPHRACSAQRLFEARDLDVWADLMSPDNRSATLLLWDTNNHFGAAGNKWQVEAWSVLQDAIDRWLAEPAPPAASDSGGGGGASAGGGTNAELFEVGSTNYQMLLDAGRTGVVLDLERGDLITLPIAWLIVLCSCGPSALLILITLPVTLLVRRLRSPEL